MKKNIVIDTYYNETYMVYVVVANEKTTIEQLRELYSDCNGKELSDDVMSGQCTTSDIKIKSNNQYGILVKYNHSTKDPSVNKKLDFINTCSHEAWHVALKIYDCIGQRICFCTPEPFCYLLGWATECIYKTLTKK